MDITDIMLLKQQQKQQQKVQKKTLIHILSAAKSEPITANDVSISDSITYPIVNKSGIGNVSICQDESAMELAMDSVST